MTLLFSLRAAVAAQTSATQTSTTLARATLTRAALSCAALSLAALAASHAAAQDHIDSSRYLRSVPVDGARGVPPDQVFALFFSDPLDARAAHGRAIALSDGTGPLSIKCELSHDRRALMLRATTPLAAGRRLSLSIDGAKLRDGRGRLVDVDGDGRPGGARTLAFDTQEPVRRVLDEAPATIVGYVYDAQNPPQPMPGAVVRAFAYPRIEGAAPLPAPAVTTDAQGFFRYTTPPFSFEQVVLVEVRKPGHSEALRQVTIATGACWRIEDAFLQPVTPPVPVSAAVGATLVDPAQPEVHLIIPPGALQANSNVGVTLLANSSFLRDRLPELVAEGDFVDVAGVFGEQTLLPVTLEVPNRYNLPVGTQIPFGKVDHNTLEWTDLRDIGTATIGVVRRRIDNTTYIEVQFDKFCSICTGYCLPYPRPGCNDGSGGNDGGNPDCDGPGSQGGNSVVSLREGHLQEFVELPGLREFGDMFKLTLGYASNAAAPSLSLSANVDYASTRPVEGTIYRFQIEGVVVEALYDRSANNQKPAGTFFWNGRDVLGNARRTGSYPYALEAISLNANAQVSIPQRFGGSGTQFFATTYPGIVRQRSQPVTGRAVLVNQTQSAYGAGWSLLQEPRLHFDTDGCLILVLGNSDYRRFRPDPQTPDRWLPPGGEDSSIVFDTGAGTYNRLLAGGTVQRFGSEGAIQSATDRYGHRIVYTHSAGRLVRVTSPTGYFFDLAYDGAGKLQQIQDSAGRTTAFVVDGQGDLVQVTDPAGIVRRFQYDAQHRLIEQIGPRGERSTYEYQNGRVVATRAYDTNGTTLLRERRFAPSALAGEVVEALRNGQGLPNNPIPLAEGRIDALVNGLGVTTLRETNGRGQTIMATDELGRVRRYSFSAARQLLAEIMPDLSRVEYTYDGAGNLTQIQEKSNATTVYSTATVEYGGPYGQLTKIVDPEGKQSELQYDALGNLLVSTDHDGNPIRFFYQDPRFPQAMTRVEGANGSVVGMTYDAHGNLLTVTDYPDPVSNPAGRTTTYAYDLAGNTTRITDPRGLFTQYAYDADGRVTTVTDELLRSVGYAYDDPTCTCQTEYLTRVTFPNATSIGYVYDGLGRVVRRTDALGKVTTTVYDAEGRTLSITNRNNQTVTYEYDAAGQMTRKLMPGGEETTYEWDLAGNLARAVDARCRVELTSDFLARTTRAVACYDIPLGTQRVFLQHRLDFTYDRVGNRLSMVDDLGATNQVYTYDNQHRLRTLTLPARGNQSWTFAYDAAGRRTAVTLSPSGPAATFTYDRADQTVAIDYATTPAFSVAYPAIDPISDILGVRRTVGGSNLVGTFANDNASQLLSAVFSAALGDGQVDRTYTYDTANRVLADEDYAYTYDDEGNLIRRVLNGSTLTDTLTWDADGRLRTVEQTIDPGGGPVTVMLAQYTYDPLGRRVLRDVNGVLRQYVWDGTRLLYTQDGAGRIERAYTHGVNQDEPLSVHDPIANLSQYYLRDAQGSVVGLADASGALLAQYHYEDFGSLVSAPSPWARQAFGYTGREFDPETGLQRHLVRVYDPRLGRFLSEDPLGFVADFNFYRYVRNNPFRGTDPFGLDWTDWIINQRSANFFAGVGDALTFGLTNVARDVIGGNEVVNKCSGAYKWGLAGGTALGLATGGVGSLSAGVRGTSNAVFYSGGRSALNAARSFAAGNGGRLLESTLGGRALNGIDTFLRARGLGVPNGVWKLASGIFAGNARGPVTAVLGSVQNGSVWLTVERPILNFLGRAINVIRL